MDEKELTWGVIAKYSFNSTSYYFAWTLTETQIADLPAEVSGKNRLEAEQTLISNIYLCLGERGQNELHNRKPHLIWRLPDTESIGRTRERVLKGEKRNVRDISITTPEAAGCRDTGKVSLGFEWISSQMRAGNSERRILRDVFVVDMSNK